MKISTKGRYALRLMLDLSLNYSDSFIPLKAIAQRRKFPTNIWNKLSMFSVRPALSKVPAALRAATG